MIKIENFLANHTSKFLNYKFYNEQIYSLNMRQEDIDSFWTFITENKNYVMGDLIINDVCITSDISSSIKRTVLDDYVFCIDRGLWYSQKTSAEKMLKALCHFKDSKNDNLDYLISVFGLSKESLSKKYCDFTEEEKILLDIYLMVLVGREYNFYYANNWEQVSADYRQWIMQRLAIIKIHTKQTFVIISAQNSEAILDINNKVFNTQNEISIVGNVSDDIKPKKRKSVKSFFSLSKIICSIFRLPYTISMIVIYLSLFVAMFVVYSSGSLISFEYARYIIWTSVSIALLMYIGFNGWCWPYFKNKYKVFVKTSPIPVSSKITYFFYTNLILSIATLVCANITGAALSWWFLTPNMSNTYITYAVFINIGYLIINLLSVALWILLYNSNEIKHI